MNEPDQYADVGQHSINITKGEDGLYTAVSPGSGLPPCRGKTSQEATQRMSTSLDIALKTNKLK